MQRTSHIADVSCAALSGSYNALSLILMCISAGEFMDVICMCYLSTYYSVIVVAAFRMHAVTGRNWGLVVATLALGIVPVGTDSVSIAPKIFMIYVHWMTTLIVCLLAYRLSKGDISRWHPSYRNLYRRDDYILWDLYRVCTR